MDLEPQCHHSICETSLHAVEEVYLENFPDIVSSKIFNRILHLKLMLPRAPELPGNESPELFQV